MRRPPGAPSTRPGPPAVGVLALQGDVREHFAILDELRARAVPVRKPADLEEIDALVLPGGESTTMSLLLESGGLTSPIEKLVAGGLPTLGTCAGMILLAREIVDGRPDQVSLGAIDLVVRRNAFGRQVESFETDIEVARIDGGPMHAVFIRAPYVEHAGAGVEILASIAGWGGREDGRPDATPASEPALARPVVCRQNNVVVAAFHPELAGDSRLHALLLGLVEPMGD